MKADLRKTGLVIALVVLVALLMAGCPQKRTPSSPPTAATGPTAAAPAAKAGAGTAAVTSRTSAGSWKWDPKSPKIDPTTIPDEPVAGTMDMKAFEAKNVLVKEEADKHRWMVRFYDQIEPGKETDWWGPDKVHYFEITVPQAAAGMKIEVPYKSDKWDLGKNLWMYYQAPSTTSPGGTSVNPGKSVALYLEFTEVKTSKPAEGSDVIGTAAGKVALGSKMMEETEVSWIAGTWEAKIVK